MARPEPRARAGRRRGERVRCLVHRRRRRRAARARRSVGGRRRRRRPRSGGARPAASTASAGATVFHAAAVIHPRKRLRELFDVNVGGTQLVLDRARRVGAGRFVHVSSNSPFGANPTPDHRFTEASPYHPVPGLRPVEARGRAARRCGATSGATSRPSSSARRGSTGRSSPRGRRSGWRAVRRGRFPLVGDGTNRRSMVFTGNLVHGLLRAEVADGRAGQRLLDRRRRALRDARGARDRAPRASSRGPPGVGPDAAAAPPPRRRRRREGRRPRCRPRAATCRRCTCSAS